MSTLIEESARRRTALVAASSRWLGGLLVLFAALVLTRAMSEGVYDIAFANLALDLSGMVGTVGLVYFVGYGVEVLASIVAGPLLDRGSPARTLVLAYLTKIGAFVLIGLGSGFLSSHLWVIVAAAATVDLVHRVGDMALFVLLPRILDAPTLVRVQGVGSTVRSAGELVSPVVAGAVLVLLPGAQALLVAAGFQVLALVLLACLAVLIRNRRTPAEAGSDAGSAADTDTADAAEEPPVSRRVVARVLSGSRAWRRFIVLDTLTTLALSSVILSLLPLMREQLAMSAARAGSFLAFTTLGAIVGGLVVTKAGEHGIYTSLRWAPALAGVGTLIAPTLGRTEWVLAAALVLFGCGFTVYLRSAALVVQLRAPMALLGTWYGLIDAVERVACAVAILATGFAFDRFGGTGLYVVFGGLLVLTAVLWSGFDREHRQDLGATLLHPSAPPTAR
ncbi:MFS transporter [Catellatospora tritici]|uniref:MFS transporter n=1 Tax=Catellatospora tritici TaxID=2851566 RepID=UPI001C2D5C67|nr:MFS transporter [Catellatospora tritici]MBV1855647.1 MFS transporter [Catellatospora tritici]